MCAVIKPLRWSALVTYFCCEGGLPSRDSALSCMSALKILGTHQKSHSPDSFATMLLCQFSAEIVQKLQMALNISSAEVTFHTDSSVNVDISLLRQDPETPIPISHDENHIVIHDIWFNLPATFKQQQTVLKLLLKTISSLPTNKAAATERAPKRRKLAKVHSAVWLTPCLTSFLMCVSDAHPCPRSFVRPEMSCENHPIDSLRLKANHFARMCTNVAFAFTVVFVKNSHNFADTLEMTLFCHDSRARNASQQHHYTSCKQFQILSCVI